jgi:hypothetical protein
VTTRLPSVTGVEAAGLPSVEWNISSFSGVTARDQSSLPSAAE